MKTWIATGAWKADGSEGSMRVQAATQREAETIAANRGLMVEMVTLDTPAPAVAQPAQIVYATPAPARASCLGSIAKYTVAGIVGIIVIGTTIAIVSDDSKSSSQTTRTSPPPEPKKTVAEKLGIDPAKKADREKLIDDCMNEANIISRIRVANGVGRAYVTPAFLALDYNAKNTFAKAFYAWCLDTDPNCRVLVFHEPMNNREIGEVTDSVPAYRAK